MDDEILEVEMELGDGSKYNMKIKEIDNSDWEGVSFKTINGNQSLFYDEEVITNLYIEVTN